MERFEKIYESMLGLLTEEYALPDVNNAFIEGGYCDRQYARMRAAYERVCCRLQVEEDQDLDIMVQAMEKIQKELCRRMYILAQEE